MVITKFFAPILTPAGAVRVIEVGELTVKLVTAIPSIVTEVAPVKFVPVTVTTVPPASGPTAGETEVIDGGPLQTAYNVTSAANG